MTPQNTSKKCAVCGNTNPSLHFEKSGYRVLRCNECQLIYLDFIPDKKELDEFYSKQYFISAERTTGYSDYYSCESYLKYNFKRRVKIIESFAEPGNILDVGCGVGFFLEVLSDLWSPFGIELSEYAAEEAVKRNHKVECKIFENSGYEPGLFNVVTMWNVFEHFNNPVDALKEANRVLKLGGLLCLYTNNVGSLMGKLMGKSWHMYLLPDHLYYFSKKNLSRALNDSGFTILKAHSETQFFAVDYLMEHFLKIFGIKLNRQKLPRFLEAILNRLFLPINFFDTITVYARKES